MFVKEKLPSIAQVLVSTANKVLGREGRVLRRQKVRDDRRQVAKMTIF